jgi:2-phospho-L-lactate guanylyltransferase
MSSSPAPERRFSVIVPVKGLRDAKTRTELPAPDRGQLALDLMSRTVTAAAGAKAVARVIVVAGDEAVASAALTAGAQVVLEPTDAGLNGALDAGREVACHDHPDDDIAIVVGDLAHLDPDDLDQVLAEFVRTGDPLIVPDHVGTGTAMLVHARTQTPPLLFGTDSAGRHQAAGYTVFAAAPASTRRDVDFPADVSELSPAAP